MKQPDFCKQWRSAQICIAPLQTRTFAARSRSQVKVIINAEHDKSKVALISGARGFAAELPCIVSTL